jgi:hypothetical protein
LQGSNLGQKTETQIYQPGPLSWLQAATQMWPKA